MSEEIKDAAKSSGKAIAVATVWALVVGGLVENWDSIAAAVLAFVPEGYAGIAAGVLALVIKLLRSYFVGKAPKKIDANY